VRRPSTVVAGGAVDCRMLFSLVTSVAIWSSLL
jgi:hypothetical protein